MTKRSACQEDLLPVSGDREELPLKKRIKLLADQDTNQSEKPTPSDVCCCSSDERSPAPSSSDSLLKMLPSILLSFARSNGVSTVSDDEDDSSSSSSSSSNQLSSKQSQTSLAVPVSVPSRPAFTQTSSQQLISKCALQAPRKLCKTQAKQVPHSVATQRNFCLNGKPLSSRPQLPTTKHPHVKKLQAIKKTLS